MFALHETTQRRVCRTVFLAGCVLPTLLTLGWVGYMLRPGRLADWQQQVAGQFHVRAEVNQVSYPKPGVTQITGLTLIELRTQRPLLAIDQLRRESRSAKLFLSAEQVELDGGQLADLAATFATWLESPYARAVELHVDKLLLQHPERQPLEFDNFRLRTEAASSPAGPSAWLQAGSGAQQLRMKIETVNEGDETAWQIVLDTQKATIPAWLLADIVPGATLCESASFRGVVQWNSSWKQQVGQLQGTFSDLQLDPWFSDTDHHFQGKAQLKIGSLAWRDNRFESLQCTFHGGPGKVGYSLLLELGHKFSCGAGGWFVQQAKQGMFTQRSLVDYDQLHGTLWLSPMGLTLSGSCPVESQSQAGCLLAVDSQPLLFGSAENVPLENVTRMLFHSDAELPTLRKAVALAERLPVAGEKKEVAQKHDGDSVIQRQ